MCGSARYILAAHIMGFAAPQWCDSGVLMHADEQEVAHALALLQQSHVAGVEQVPAASHVHYPLAWLRLVRLVARGVYEMAQAVGGQQVRVGVL